jgi:hypothetical protein
MNELRPSVEAICRASRGSEGEYFGKSVCVCNFAYIDVLYICYCKVTYFCWDFISCFCHTLSLQQSNIRVYGRVEIETLKKYFHNCWFYSRDHNTLVKNKTHIKTSDFTVPYVARHNPPAIDGWDDWRIH